MPLSIVISNLLKFGIQLAIFFGFYFYYVFNGMSLDISLNILYLPILIISMGLLGLGLGMAISSMVTKYRDLTFLVSFGVQLLMYLSAVVYPIELMRETMKDYAWIVEYNPMTTIIVTFRNLMLNTGVVLIEDILYMMGISFTIFILGMLVFNKTEKSFIDTI